ncbi:MAG: hypothetical protein GY751_09195, partial [Bacteroidetes bacterium]|nr:hypothetical protein [Bacteroidota bacterium]
YYVRAYATNSEGTGYGEQRTFTTMAAGEPIVETDSSTTEVLSTSAILGGNVLADGGADLESKGICWNTSPFAVDADKDDLECSTEDNTATGAIEGKLTGLNFDTTYYARAYATNGLGTAFGPDPIVNFTTDSAEKAKVTLADNYITIIIEVTQQSAKFIAKVTDDGDAHVTAKGFVWNTSGLPIVDSNDDKTEDSDPAGIGQFEGSTQDAVEDDSKLIAGKTYYVRAYATNAVATAYGKQERFTLKSEPTVATGEATVVTSSSATITGNNIVSDGGNDVTVSGVCYGISANPSATCTADGDTDEGQFTSQITGLDPETTYYVRAYATNSEGTSYGNDKTFKTVIVVDKGDVDGDGNVDLQDAILALKVLAGLNPQDVYVGADVNGDGQIGIEEVIFILRKVMA